MKKKKFLLLCSIQALSCPTPYPPINGQLVRPCLEKFGSRCVITCNHGYHLNGTGFLECSKDGSSKTNWNLFENTCEGIFVLFFGLFCNCKNM